MTDALSEKEVLRIATQDAAYQRGYRRGRIEAAAELHAIYRGRILDATSILSAPIPQVAQTSTQDAAEPVQEQT